MIALMFLWLGACHHRAGSPPVVSDAPPVASAAPAGRVQDGVFVDDRFGLTLPVAAGWTLVPGRADGALRLTATDARSGAVVRVFARPVEQNAPEARPDCNWNFQAEGHFRILRVSGPVAVATCTPDDPVAPHTFLVILSRPEASWHLEIDAPGSAMVAAKRAGDALLAGARWSSGT